MILAWYFLFCHRETNATASVAIFDSVQETLAASPFNFSMPEKQARIISGKDEGVFGWITVNYVSNRFKVVGIIHPKVLAI